MSRSLTTLKTIVLAGTSLLAVPSFAQEVSPILAPKNSVAFASYVEQMRAECASFDNGELDVDIGRIDQGTDFDRDGLADALFDSAGLSCSTSASFSGGTGGTVLSIFLSATGSTRQIQMQGYQIVHSERNPVLLLSLHGSACARYGYQACFASYSFEEGDFAAAGGSMNE